MHLPLPPAEMRWGGPRYRDDEVYITSGVRNARMLQAECGIGPDCRILDIGCGQGRLLNGLLNCFGRIQRYVGIDVHEPSIRWLQENVAPVAPFAAFHHVPVRNERYNPKGWGKLTDLDFPEPFDYVTLFSVFSHMRLNDITNYLAFIRSVLAYDGKVFLTAFVEDDVPIETENPEGYHQKWSGALHCVRLNRQEFEQRTRRAGLQIELFRHRAEHTIQSSYVLSVADRQSSARPMRQSVGSRIALLIGRKLRAHWYCLPIAICGRFSGRSVPSLSRHSA
jgi:cyclopropane fatty-acyl-phospholipid synthase-like methyltransferase